MGNINIEVTLDKNIDFTLDTPEIEILLEAPIITRFIEMQDTPTTYVANGLKMVRVNVAENSLEFFHQSDEVLYVKQMTEAQIQAFKAPGKRFIVDNFDTEQLEYWRGLDRRIIG